MADSAPLRPCVILLVEDEPGIRGALELLLQLEGFEVITAANGVEALERLTSATCDLVITDQMMPRMDGCTFLTRLRALPPYAKTPAILISAVHRAPEGLEPLANAFIGKPFEATKLLHTIRELLRAHGARFTAISGSS